MSDEEQIRASISKTLFSRNEKDGCINSFNEPPTDGGLATTDKEGEAIRAFLICGITKFKVICKITINLQVCNR